MKAKVGVVGPKDSLDLVSEIAKEYEDQLELMLFIYEFVEETTAIVDQNQHLVDVWIFSGLTPYLLAKKSNSNQPFFYLTLNGSSLMKSLLESGYKDKKVLSKLSVDMLDWQHITDTFSDLKLPYEDIRWYEIKDYIPINEVINFHLSVYEEDHNFICFTCLSDVYESLNKKGIPVYRITPTRASIQSTIKLALQYRKALHFQQSQITVIVVKVSNIEKSDYEKMISYDAHRLNLELQSTILSFTEEISGSFVPIGIGTFHIYSTRGSFENIEQQVSFLLEQLMLITDLPANIGIGYGDTTLAAEENARLALLHAQNYDEFSAFLVDNYGEVEGPLESVNKITFGYRNEDKEIGKKLKESGVTITTFNKILSIQQDSGKHSISAKEMANWLKMSERNARRILNNLMKAGVAEIIGEESPGSRGRPRNIYKVGIEKNDD